MERVLGKGGAQRLESEFPTHTEDGGISVGFGGFPYGIREDYCVLVYKGAVKYSKMLI
jgi:hypothetical protein